MHLFWSLPPDVVCVWHSDPLARHQPGDPFARDASPLILQFHMNTWTAISTSVRDKNLPNLLSQLSIFSFALTGRALAPSVVATFRDSKNAAHDGDGKFLFVLFDKLIFHLDSREKMLTAFFNISRSCWTLSSSRLRRRFSSSSGVWCPLPGNASFPCWANSFRHW